MKERVGLYPRDSRAARFAPIEDLLARFTSLDLIDWVAIVILIGGLIWGYVGMKMRHP
jgi:hypothetical protein